MSRKESNYFIGVISKDRYQGLDTLLHSLRFVADKVHVIDASDPFDRKCYDAFPNIAHYYYNVPKHISAVVHTKNIMIHQFLRSSCDYLFLIEDDMKVLDCDIFDEYIRISKKYHIPHMNYTGRSDIPDNFIYDHNNDIQIGERLFGVFSFYTRKCIENVGLMNPELCHNCWEHVEYTARIHQYYNYFPQFYHFPDVKDSWEYLKMQRIPSTIGNMGGVSNKIHTQDRIKMCNMLGWKDMPDNTIKRFNPSTIKRDS